ncbi:carbohydrate ABC transporter permease [Streptomyces sp. NPDC046716]|uniref:carbohydrate ABC transporter permease n=1 Tax=Streptomyces sp. NPDC046716 TaxID=3157093 RepID=UPI0033E2451A
MATTDLRPAARAGRSGGAARPAPAVTTARHRIRPARVAVNLVLLVISLLFVLPLVWMVFASVSSTAGFELTLPVPPTLDNFHAILNTETTFRPLLNGLLLCGGATLICVVVSILAAYPLSRYRSRLRRPFLYTVLFTTGLPITAVMIPVYSMFVQVELIDSMVATTLFLAASALPIGIWLMKNFMDGVPVVLEEAARIDGANAMQSLTRVVLPLMWPGVTVVTVFTFISMWGNFFVPFVLLLSPEKLPASVSVFTFLSAHDQTQYGQLAAFSLVYTLPVVMLYLLLTRRLGGGFALGGALKG